MIFVIMNYGVDRNQHGRRWTTKAVVFAVSATTAGIVSGAVLGAVGLLLETDVRRAIGLAAGAVAAAVASIQLVGLRLPVPQRNCETGQLWMNTGALTSAALNGASMGTGFVTRIGYWLWYVVPLAAILSGSPAYGAIIFGCYGFARGIAPLIAISQMLLLKHCADRDITKVQDWMVRQAMTARRLGDAQLIATAAAAATIWLG